MPIITSLEALLINLKTEEPDMIKTSLLQKWPPTYDSHYLPQDNEKYWYKDVETATKEDRTN